VGEGMVGLPALLPRARPATYDSLAYMVHSLLLTSMPAERDPLRSPVGPRQWTVAVQSGAVDSSGAHLSGVSPDPSSRHARRLMSASAPGPRLGVAQRAGRAKQVGPIDCYRNGQQALKMSEEQ
jgi:hypothetical protein